MDQLEASGIVGKALTGLKPGSIDYRYALFGTVLEELRK